MAYVRVQRSRRFERSLFDLRLRAEAAQAAPDVTPDLDEGIALEIRHALRLIGVNFRRPPLPLLK